MSSAELFDRKNVLAMLDAQCFGEPASSAVILGAHKVGKTYLLDHICSRRLQGQETLFCRIDMYSLRASETLSDDTFLRYFLVSIVDQIENWIQVQTVMEPIWQEDLKKAEEERTAGRVTETQVTIAGLHKQLEQLRVLRDVTGRIGKLLDQKDPIQVFHVVLIFNSLRRINKRIVLIIDEFHQMMKEKGFTDRLFSFLRGANNEGKIVALVSSPIHLMDPSLHPTPEGDRNDRLSLFNHFQMQFLDPFSDQETEGFLDWLPPILPPLTLEETQYIRRLGGGSPYFLKMARELFVDRQRPKNEKEREDFEKGYASPFFESAFQELWQRCSTEEGTVLLRVASGKDPEGPAVMKLQREGYLVRGTGAPQLFSTLFAEFVRQQKSPPVHLQPPVADRRVAPAGQGQQPARRSTDVIHVKSVTLPYHIFPTALYVAYPEQADLITFQLENTSREIVKVRLSARVVDFSQPIVKEFELSPGTSSITLQAVLRQPRINGLNDPAATRIEYRVVLVQSGVERVVTKDMTDIIRLLPANNFLFALYDPEQKVLNDFTWLISAWVRRPGKRLEKVRRRASELCTLEGYVSPAGKSLAEHVRKQVAALYQALQEEDLDYQNSVLVFHQEANQYVQRVRLPEESLEQKAANCLDASVLFANLLHCCDLDPVILVLPGHALAGWRDGEGNCEFLEATVIAKATFEEACQKGHEQFQKVEKLYTVWCKASPYPTTIPDAEDFAIPVDVHRVWQDRKILPVSTG